VAKIHNADFESTAKPTNDTRRILEFITVRAQQLAAQPLGRVRFVVTILAGIIKPHFGAHSLSLGQVGCSRVLGVQSGDIGDT
jgi:hypothetical protein